MTILDIPFSEYLAIDALNASKLKAIAESPLLAKWREDNPTEETPAMRVGRAGHSLSLTPEETLRDFAVYEGKRDKRVAAYQEFRSANDGKTILSAREYEQARQIARAIRNHPEASRILSGGRAEQTRLWTEPRTGTPCKVRLDYINDERLIDIKSTSATDLRHFEYQIEDLRYHLQLAFYADAVAATTGEILPVTLIAVQSKAPHDVWVIDMPEGWLQDGAEAYQKALDLYLECQRTNYWPGKYPQRIEARRPVSALPPTATDDEHTSLAEACGF